MLESADGDPDEVLTTLLPRAGIVTRRVVAINAVLAGCPPATFPVVLTAVRALAKPEMNLRGVNATTHLVAPLVLVHGEIATTAGFHAGRRRVRSRQPRQRHRRARGPAGAAARRGRAPGSGDAATHGQPAKYTFCAAENLDASPWEGYAVSRGVDAPSAVTVHCGEGPHNVHDMEKDGDPQLILDKLASSMASLGMNNAPISQGEFFVILGPEHAYSLASNGFARDDVSLVPLRPRPPAGGDVPPALRGTGVDAVDEDGARRPPAAHDRRTRQHPRARRRAVRASTRCSCRRGA